MKIQVEYIDSHKNIYNKNYRIGKLAFCKHLAVAGQGFMPRLNKTLRSIGMFLHYRDYMQGKAFRKNHFSLPPVSLYDPTEKGQFSNLAGKAIADYLSKRINNSFFTVNYEAAMKINNFKIKGDRPDLIAFSKSSVFALEAKGYTQGAGNMAEHKSQALSGPINVNFGIACVAFHLYKGIKCKYHDPANENNEYNSQLLKELSKLYYRGLLEFLDGKYFKVTRAIYRNEEFFELSISSDYFEEIFQHDFSYRLFWLYEIMDSLNFRLLITARIEEFAEDGLNNDVRYYEPIEEDYLYIDSDRVGLKIDEDCENYFFIV